MSDNKPKFVPKKKARRKVRRKPSAGAAAADGGGDGASGGGGRGRRGSGGKKGKGGRDGKGRGKGGKGRGRGRGRGGGLHMGASELTMPTKERRMIQGRALASAGAAGAVKVEKGVHGHGLSTADLQDFADGGSGAAAGRPAMKDEPHVFNVSDDEESEDGGRGGASFPTETLVGFIFHYLVLLNTSLI
jgi:hypothetical protein